MARGGAEVQRMVRGWRGDSRGGVWRQPMLGLLLGLSVGAVLGAPTAMQPTDSGGDVGCARPLVDVVWGFLLTLLALSIAFWSSWNQLYVEKEVKMFGLIFAIFVPISHLKHVLQCSCDYGVLLWHCHKMEYGRMRFKHLCLMLRPWSKSSLRILASCSIIIYVQKRVPFFKGVKVQSRKIEESWLWVANSIVLNESEAMVIGDDGARRTRSMNYERKELSKNGLLALFWGEYFSSEQEQNNFLPEYDELKYVRGNSGFAMIAIAIQALGYIYAVTFRSVKELTMAPIEVIGLVFNILLLVGASLYSTSNLCVRPLVIYMNDEREEKFTRILKSRPRLDFDMKYNLAARLSDIGMGIIVLFICGPILIYFIISLKKSTNMVVVVPLVIFGVGLLLSLLYVYLLRSDISSDIGGLFFSLTVVTNMVAYVWAIIVTFHHWKSQHFDTRPELLDWSQVIPFIG